MDSPGTYEDGRVSRNECESSEPLAGCLGRPAVGTAKAPHITCRAGKLWRAGEWGGWGRISDDGPGQHNPDRSEGPWGRAAEPLARRRRATGVAPRLRARAMRRAGDAKVGSKPWRGADRSAPPGKAPTDRPALAPYRGKPAVRNLRGDDGNVGIMRSPISAIVLPDSGPYRCERLRYRSSPLSSSGHSLPQPPWPPATRCSRRSSTDTSSSSRGRTSDPRAEDAYSQSACPGVVPTRTVSVANLHKVSGSGDGECN
jgi:hypothetical protein